MKYRRTLRQYVNGNYNVKIYYDGTKIRWTSEDDFKPEFPESIDLKITNYCDMNCPMCHERSTENGKHANLNLPFLYTLKAGVELAIGGGNPLSHPNLITFLERMKRQGVICNITVNQFHLLKNVNFVQRLIDEKLVYGVGVSYTGKDQRLFDFCKKNGNAVIHLILGIHDKNTLDELSNKNLKILILGYKQFGRGKDFYSEKIEKNIEEVKSVLTTYKNEFSVISFDNLSFEQLSIESKISKKDKELHYMGNDGQFTMYIDAVEEKFAKNSTAELEERQDILDDILKMFKSLVV